MKTVYLPVIFICVLLSLPAAEAKSKNGFDLDNSTVPTNEIRKTGVRRDGIPSIDDPKFVAADDADFLRDKDRVIGVFKNGLARAYPIRILDHHEVVNDEFDGEAILITYCPLCYTGMVFSAQASDFGLKFGVSGLLYNSDVLLYDRNTGSLWSQIMSKAITGPLKGMTLLAVPASHTTWRQWRQRHPTTIVLSTDTGFRRNYRQSPYLEYARSRSLLFPVKERDERYRNKALVLGVRLGTTIRAYPFDELRKNGAGSFEDVIGGRQVTIEWSDDDDFARVLDDGGEELSSVIAYWFAWYAFHPDTEVFRHIASDN